MSLLVHSSLTIFTRWAGYLLDGIASVIVARSVGPTGKGILAVLNVIAGLAMQMGNLGFHAATTHFAAREPEALGRIAWTSLALAPAIGTLLTLGFGAVVFAFPALVPHVPSGLLLITLATIPPAFTLLFFQNILLGQQRILTFNLLDIGGKAMALPLVIVIVFLFRGGVPELLIAGAFLGYGTAVLAVKLVFRTVQTPWAIDGTLLARMLGYGLRSYVSCLLAYLIVRSDMLLVNYFLGTAQAGIYAVAVNMTDLLLVFPTAVGTMLFPRISAAPNDRGSLTAAASRHTAAGMLLLCSAAGALAPLVIRHMFGAPFAQAAAPFRILLPGILALSLEMIFMNDLAGRGLPPVVILVPALGLTANIVLNLLFIPRYGLIAAAASSSLAYGIMLIVAWSAFTRRTAIPAAQCWRMTGGDLRSLLSQLKRLMWPGKGDQST